MSWFKSFFQIAKTYWWVVLLCVALDTILWLGVSSYVIEKLGAPIPLTMLLLIKIAKVTSYFLFAFLSYLFARAMLNSETASGPSPAHSTPAHDGLRGLLSWRLWAAYLWLVFVPFLIAVKLLVVVPPPMADPTMPYTILRFTSLAAFILVPLVVFCSTATVLPAVIAGQKFSLVAAIKRGGFWYVLSRTLAAAIAALVLALTHLWGIMPLFETLMSAFSEKSAPTPMDVGEGLSGLFEQYPPAPFQLSGMIFGLRLCLAGFVTALSCIVCAAYLRHAATENSGDPLT